MHTTIYIHKSTRDRLATFKYQENIGFEERMSKLGIKKPLTLRSYDSTINYLLDIIDRFEIERKKEEKKNL
jgi:hypothetical protein